MNRFQEGRSVCACAELVGEAREGGGGGYVPQDPTPAIPIRDHNSYQLSPAACPHRLQTEQHIFEQTEELISTEYLHRILAQYMT